MDIQDYISSGILELYVYGALNEEESRKVSAELKKHPEVEKEVEEIEKALQQLAIAAAPYNPEVLLTSITSKLSKKTRIVEVPQKQTTNLVSYMGWAASILLLAGLFFLFSKNNQLREALNKEQAEKAEMQQQIVDSRQNVIEAESLLKVLRNRNIARIPLAGQKVNPSSYATAFWNSAEDRTYIDAKGLPEPPAGKVYQVWSLTLNPLSPTSIGLLDNFSQNDYKVFILKNTNQSQAFGITLEPEGGSPTPTMNQLYVLGKV